MDRNIVYPGSIPLDTDILALNRNAMVGIGALTAAVLGGNVVADGLACTPTSPASLTVNIGPGSITQLSPLDANAYGSLAADVADQLVKTGINLQSTSFTLAPPANSGQSINYLIEAAFDEADASPVVLPYVNAANPSQPYSGPNNSGTAQNTQRIQRVQLQLKPGAAANAGTQVTPVVDAGWVGLYVITVNFGQTTITASEIVTIPGAPFVNFKLPSLRPGFSSMQVFTASGTFVVPNGVSMARVTVIGGGGAGGYHSTMPSGGGGAGGEAVGIIGLTPGQSIAVAVGAGGAVPASPGNGGAGGASSFGALLSATGGSGGAGGTTTQFAMAGGAGGAGTGGQINRGGSYGSDSIVLACRGGDGGGPGNGRASSGPINGLNAIGYGGGGGGGGTTTTGSPPEGFQGGNGAPGIVIVEY
jgi:hypothetical protein